MHNEITYLFKIISDKTKIKADSKLKKYGLTLSQARILHTLEKSNGEMTQKELEDFLQVSHPTVVGILSRLQKSGYITCGFDRAHGKNKIVRATQKANDFNNEMKTLFENWDKQIFFGLTEAELKNLTDILEKIYNNTK